MGLFCRQTQGVFQSAVCAVSWVCQQAQDCHSSFTVLWGLGMHAPDEGQVIKSCPLCGVHIPASISDVSRQC